MSRALNRGQFGDEGGLHGGYGGGRGGGSSGGIGDRMKNSARSFGPVVTSLPSNQSSRDLGSVWRW